MTGFGADWLRRREPFDAATRSVELAHRFAAAIVKQPVTRIVDLAAGTGASFRALAPLIAGDQAWLLVDHDARLISAQTEEIQRWARAQGFRCTTGEDGVEVAGATGRWRARAQTLDLARDLENIDFSACDGATTTAFLDLVSVTWLDRLCDALGQHGTPLLAALTIDGRREWHPALPADAQIDDAFRRHQAGDKGFGPACGPLAASHLRNRLTARGYDVATARSDWQIAGIHRDMLLDLFEESGAVACETEPSAASVSNEWSAQRREHIETGRLSIEIGHTDLLAMRVIGRQI